MKRSALSLFFTVAMLVLLAPHNVYAQSGTSPTPSSTNQDPAMQELLSEVRQLRIAVQRMSVNAYRAQVLVERLRLQQEQVNRLTQELNTVRNQVNETKAAQVNFKERLDEAEKRHASGLLPESEVNATKAAMEEFKQREQSLTEREIQLSTDLNTERRNLTDLNKRLDDLEREMLMTNQGEESKGGVKRQ
jgi:chromosome segregation ATPase